jgi:hypothetical protein
MAGSQAGQGEDERDNREWSMPGALQLRHADGGRSAMPMHAQLLFYNTMLSSSHAPAAPRRAFRERQITTSSIGEAGATAAEVWTN